MTHGLSHLRKHTPQKHAPFLKFFDRSMFGIALIAPIMTIPQLIQIWQYHQVQGVSLLTWGAYTLVSCLWLAYGIFHKDKTIILANLLLFVLDASITAGVLLLR